ncbi:MAG: class I SAM-dependent methyltransferase [Pirellulales bacterium]
MSSAIETTATINPDNGRRPVLVELADGSLCDLTQLDQPALARLQLEQERAFARRFVEHPKGSPQRKAAFRQGYDTITAIFAAANGRTGLPVAMGCDPRYERLVVELLARQRREGMLPALFEVGYGCGALLACTSRAGFRVGGIEVSPAMHAQAEAALAGDACELLLGDFLSEDHASLAGRYTLVFWNDVFEHIPPDEIADFLAAIYRMLLPGGQLVTITPNWHMRPSDVTGDFYPPRTTAQGVHLKEYTLREVTSLLRQAGFTHVATPLFVTRGRMVLAGRGLAPLKRLFEPALERLPFPLAKLIVRGAGLSCTVASKVRSEK